MRPSSCIKFCSLVISKMPRPGSRPYECVKRAWHNEKHQAMRGSVVQQIFRFFIASLSSLSDDATIVRIAHGCHRDITKKNKEWLEKLPLVVLKAEEIMYSKANSEKEYIDPTTFWDRLNDAIDTMIRRDETSESGEFMPPCIEAALILGCFPVKASRSQRHSNPRNYLNPLMQEQPSSSMSAISVLLPRNNDDSQVLCVPSQRSISTSVYELHYGNCAIEETQLNNNELSERVFNNRVRARVPVSESNVCNSFASPNLTLDAEMDPECDLSLRLSFCTP